MSPIKMDIPLGEKTVLLRSSSYCGVLFCRHIGRRLLVAWTGAGLVAWERCLRAVCKKRGGTRHCLHTAPHVALLWLARYNTALQKIFPSQRHLIWNVVWPCFGGVPVFLLRSWNNTTGRVYCSRARKQFASAARWSSIVVPYLSGETSLEPTSGESARLLCRQMRADHDIAWRKPQPAPPTPFSFGLDLLL